MQYGRTSTANVTHYNVLLINNTISLHLSPFSSNECAAINIIFSIKSSFISLLRDNVALASDMYFKVASSMNGKGYESGTLVRTLLVMRSFPKSPNGVQTTILCKSAFYPILQRARDDRWRFTRIQQVLDPLSSNSTYSPNMVSPVYNPPSFVSKRPKNSVKQD